jgi:hypothetical protein
LEWVEQVRTSRVLCNSFIINTIQIYIVWEIYATLKRGESFEK